MHSNIDGCFGRDFDTQWLTLLPVTSIREQLVINVVDGISHLVFSLLGSNDTWL